METIQEFIARYIALTDTRNAATTTPVKLMLVDPEDIQRKFILVVSETEPSFEQIPFNVLWIFSAPVDQPFGKLFRRVGESSSGDFQYSWEQLGNYSEIFSVDQYYQSVPQDLREHGITSLSSFIGLASTTNHGLGYSTTDDNTVVSMTDPRITDSRYPLDHEHPEQARRLLYLNADQYARIDQSLSPQEGKMLFLGERDSENPLEFSALWRYPVVGDITSIDRSLLSLSLAGASSIQEQSSSSYVVTAHFSDGSQRVVTPTSFISDTPSIAIINLAGTLSAQNIQATSQVRITATYDEGGVYVDTDMVVGVTLGLEITSIRIQGSLQVNEENSAVYAFIGTFNNGQESTIVPNTVSLNPPELGSFNTQGLFTAGEAIDGNKTIALNAEYNFDGVTVQATKQVQIIDNTPYPVTLEVLGPVRVTEREDATYTTKLTFSDGQVYVLPLDSFVQASDTFSSFDGTTLSVGILSETQTVILTASFTQFSTTITGSLSVTLDNLPPTIDRIDITGPSEVFADRSGNALMPNFELQILYDDGSTDVSTIMDMNVSNGLDIQIQSFPSLVWSSGTLSLASSNMDEDYVILITGLDDLSTTDTFKDTVIAPFNFSLRTAIPISLRNFQEITSASALMPDGNVSTAKWALFDILYANPIASRETVDLSEALPLAYLPHDLDLETADWATITSGAVTASYVQQPEFTFGTKVERAEYGVALGGGQVRLYPGVKFFTAFDSTSEGIDLLVPFSVTWRLVYVRLSYGSDGTPIYNHISRDETFDYTPN